MNSYTLRPDIFTLNFNVTLYTGPRLRLFPLRPASGSDTVHAATRTGIHTIHTKGHKGWWGGWGG